MRTTNTVFVVYLFRWFIQFRILSGVCALIIFPLDVVTRNRNEMKSSTAGLLVISTFCHEVCILGNKRKLLFYLPH